MGSVIELPWDGQSLEKFVTSLFPLNEKTRADELLVALKDLQIGATKDSMLSLADSWNDVSLVTWRRDQDNNNNNTPIPHYWKATCAILKRGLSYLHSTEKTVVSFKIVSEKCSIHDKNEAHAEEKKQEAKRRKEEKKQQKEEDKKNKKQKHTKTFIHRKDTKPQGLLKVQDKNDDHKYFWAWNIYYWPEDKDTEIMLGGHSQPQHENSIGFEKQIKEGRVIPTTPTKVKREGSKLQVSLARGQRLSLLIDLFLWESQGDRGALRAKAAFSTGTLNTLETLVRTNLQSKTSLDDALIDSFKSTLSAVGSAVPVPAVSTGVKVSNTAIDLFKAIAQRARDKDADLCGLKHLYCDVFRDWNGKVSIRMYKDDGDGRREEVAEYIAKDPTLPHIQDKAPNPNEPTIGAKSCYMDLTFAWDTLHRLHLRKEYHTYASVQVFVGLKEEGEPSANTQLKAKNSVPPQK